jgi:hypothetical protein
VEAQPADHRGARGAQEVAPLVVLITFLCSMSRSSRRSDNLIVLHFSLFFASSLCPNECLL